MSKNLYKLKQFVKLRILHSDDSPHRIAMGMALGLFIGWTPAIGLHILMVLVSTLIIRANRLVALTCVWISNPLTIIPIYYPSYLVGKYVLKFLNANRQLCDVEVQEVFKKLSHSESFFVFFSVDFWRDMFTFFWQKGLELGIGCTIVGLLVASAGYMVTYYAVVWYRRKHPHLLMTDSTHLSHKSE